MHVQPAPDRNGLMAYTGDYGGYFPSSHAWGHEGFFRMTMFRDLARNWAANGISSAAPGHYDERGEVLVTGPRDIWGTSPPGHSGHRSASYPYAYTPNYYFRTIYSGRRVGDRGHQWDRSDYPDTADSGQYENDQGPPQPGDLAMAPNGIGFLIQGGYVPDARAYFCPSAADSMPPDRGSGVWDGGSAHADDHFAPMHTTITQFRTAGALNHEGLSRGDWRELELMGSIWRGRAVQSNYNYRNVPSVLPVTLPHMNISWQTRMRDYDPPVTEEMVIQGSRRFVIRYTRPGVVTSPGAPPFKTARLLGGRAIVSDSFSNHNIEGLGVYSPPDWPVPGMGQYAHIEGYNVAYGDGSSAWYGDPRGEVLWWAHGEREWTAQRNHVTHAQQAISFNGVYEGVNIYGFRGTGHWGYNGGRNPGAVSMWNLLDRHHGIDVEDTF